MRFVIMGAGAVGGVIGARLAQHGQEVALVARGEHLAAIERDGMRLRSAAGDDFTVSLPVTDDPASLDIGSNDVVLLAVKGQDTDQALHSLASCTGPDTPIVCAQNGVVNERRALRRFARVYGMIVMCPAGFFEPGTVIAYCAPVTGILDIGRYPAGRDDLADELTTIFASSGFSSETVEDVMRWKYRKLILNLPNAARAVCGPEARSGRIAQLAVAEGEACLAAAGIDVASAEEDFARRGDLLQLPGTGEFEWNMDSSSQSLARHVGSIEVDELNGEIVLLGRLHRVPTPANELLQRVARRFAGERGEPGSLAETDLLAELTSDEPDA